MSYVVRFELQDEFTFKVFERRRDALQLYNLGYTIDSDLASVTLFQVETSNARDAIAQVKAGKATLLETSKEFDRGRELIESVNGEGKLRLNIDRVVQRYQAKRLKRRI